MNRKIIFRGYNLKNKKWLYGYYLVNRGKHFIAEEGLQPPGMTWEDFEVDPESVGQYVGEYNGKAIFEGDMVRVTETDGYKSVYIGFVVYDIVNCRFAVNKRFQARGMGGCEKIPITGEKQTFQIDMGNYCEYYYQYEVIGNEFEYNLVEWPTKATLEEVFSFGAEKRN